jgi:hypothetical protein
MFQTLKVQPSHCPWWGAPSYHFDRPIELHHREPAAGGGEGVALAGVGLLADQKLVAGGLPGG